MLKILLFKLIRCIGEFFELFYLHFKSKGFEWAHQLWVRKNFYSDPTFKLIDLAIRGGPNPYRIKEAYPYGETPLFGLKKIADDFNIQSNDKLIEIGCGKGRAAFFLHYYTGCQVRGVDHIAAFIEHAKEVKKRCNINRIDFFHENLFETDLSWATIVYLYGTGLNEKELEAILVKFKKLSPQCKIIIAGVPVNLITPVLSILKDTRFRCAWGETPSWLLSSSSRC
jgi:SAM-dependent methyltransferase